MQEPYPVTAGAEVLFNLSGTQKPGNIILAGTLDATVRYFGTRVFKKSGELCDCVSCPLFPGNFSYFLRNGENDCELTLEHHVYFSSITALQDPLLWA